MLGEMQGDGPADAAMERYADGDAAAFAIVYDALAPRLLGLLRRQAPQYAEDLVQQTFFQMHLARGTFVRGAQVRPWAFAIARRLLIDRLRREKHVIHVELPEWVAADVEPPDASSIARETARELERLLARIPARQRLAFEVVRGDGLSMREAADTLGTSVTAVKLRASRAMRALRSAFMRTVGRE